MVPIRINPATPDKVQHLIRTAVEEQFRDVHSMMMLPNCNYKRRSNNRPRDAA